MEEALREKLRTKTIEFILACRRQYLMNGANAIKHWEQIQNRCLSACRRASTPEDWCTKVLRGLQLAHLDSSGSSTLTDLVAAVIEGGATDEWLRLVQDELGYLMATARGIADEQRAAKEAKR